VAVVEWPDKKNLMLFNVKVKPDSGLWKSAAYSFEVTVPKMYPHEPPKVQCVTPIYHPNIDWGGAVCLNILRKDWKPVLDLNAVIYGIIMLFYEPNANDPLNIGACVRVAARVASTCGSQRLPRSSGPTRRRLRAMSLAPSVAPSCEVTPSPNWCEHIISNIAKAFTCVGGTPMRVSGKRNMLHDVEMVVLASSRSRTKPSASTARASTLPTASASAPPTIESTCSFSPEISRSKSAFPFSICIEPLRAQQP
jgi:ubiquitin-protein ligase